jgi:putative ABC transport system ATP-binding protein
MSWPEPDIDPIPSAYSAYAPDAEADPIPRPPAAVTMPVPTVTPAPAPQSPAPQTAVTRRRGAFRRSDSQKVERAAPHAAKTSDVIVVEKIVKTYAIGEIKVHALRNVSLTIERGDFVAIMGASGSGKSTLMNIIGCLDVATHGRYLLDGVDVRGMSEDELSDVRNRKIGFVFQSFNLIPRTEAIVNVELPLIYAGCKKADRKRRAERALVEVGLSERMHHMPNELSGGQQQRVAVARAIATNPAIILADEPTGNLDTRATQEVLEIFGRLNAEGRTVVLITHEPDVAAHSKRVLRLIDGKIVEDVRNGPVVGPPPMYHARTAIERQAHETSRATS